MSSPPKPSQTPLSKRPLRTNYHHHAFPMRKISCAYPVPRIKGYVCPTVRDWILNSSLFMRRFYMCRAMVCG